MATREVRIGILGPGRLGTSLAAALAQAGFPVAAVWDRNPEVARRVAARLGAATLAADTPNQLVEASDAVFLTVPDGGLAEVCASLAWRPGQWAIHCSGALGLEPLTAASAAGAVAGCLHPLQTFPTREPEPDRFLGIVCGIEAPGELGAFLEEAARRLGSRTVRLEGIDRALYHAAAVLVSNHVVALAAAASRLWASAGLPPTEARTALSPLLLAAAANVSQKELTEALTGPVARGDIATVDRHLRALAEIPDIRELYRRLSLELLALPLGHDPAIRERLRELLA